MNEHFYDLITKIGEIQKPSTKYLPARAIRVTYHVESTLHGRKFLSRNIIDSFNGVVANVVGNNGINLAGICCCEGDGIAGYAG